jgi:steroid 5-alpha reductase family enzyme
MQKGWCFYYFAAFTFVFMMQAFFSLVVNSSALFISFWSNSDLYFLDWIGFGIWVFGFGFEVISDWQL